MVRTTSAMTAGVLGGLVISGILALTRLVGGGASLELMLGTLVFPESEATAWAFGIGLHLAFYAAVAIFYAWVFHRGTRAASAQIGFLLGLVHAWIVAIAIGLALNLLQVRNPDAIEAFTVHIDALGVVAFCLAQVAYGAVVGAVYGRGASPVGV
jgi:hypothetical protein